ncbi:MAG: hypothetical protein A3C51_03455 [Omnitrophica bacterium RIFCSPHIGHO2_02_FULL_46_20]|nr:MAG: hypothetical protein A3C51_03455 [Omnitrophica bacterium RIFCSPHIGHO2_02_FULL_46_20]
MSFFIVGCSPHTAQSLDLGTLTILKLDSSALNTNSLPVKHSPIPKTNFKASLAWITPITPATAPRIPASWQLGIAPGGGGSGNKHL